MRRPWIFSARTRWPRTSASSSSTTLRPQQTRRCVSGRLAPAAAPHNRAAARSPSLRHYGTGFARDSTWPGPSLRAASRPSPPLLVDLNSTNSRGRVLWLKIFRHQAITPREKRSWRTTRVSSRLASSAHMLYRARGITLLQLSLPNSEWKPLYPHHQHKTSRGCRFLSACTCKPSQLVPGPLLPSPTQPHSHLRQAMPL